MSRSDAEGKENSKPESIWAWTPIGVDRTEGAYGQIETKICNVGLK